MRPDYKKLFIKMKAGIALVAVLLLQTGCKEDFLEVPPQGQTPGEDFWQTEAHATAAVNAMYANLREWNQVAFAPIAVESIPSDDAEKGSDPGDATFMNTFDNFTATSTEGQIGGFWSGQYQEINLANQVLTNVPNIQMDESLKNRYLAEAKFIRAYAYFRLVRAFGGVPLRLHVPKDASEYNIPRNTREEVYAAIEKDLTEAAAVLPVSYGPKDIGRATKGAALALHAKVVLYQTTPGGTPQKWQQVYDLSKQVMDLNVYNLFPNYEQLFRIPNENSVESVFEIQAQVVPGNCDVSNSQYSEVQGVRGVPGGGWGFNVPTQDLANAYEPGDPRRDATIIFRGETTPQGDLIPTSVPNPMYNQKSYVPFSISTGCGASGSEQNIRVLRFADVLLMHAEAANELGKTQEALTALNRVRARARGGNPNVLPDVTTTNKDQLRNAIWHERRVELAMEFDRFFDLVRQGRAAQVLGPKGFVAGKNEVWPIPQNEIDLSAGVLTQNPGY